MYTGLFLTFICPCILNIIPNHSQQDPTFLDLFIYLFIYLFISTDALHVSGGSSVHHQEFKNCIYSFRYCQPIMMLTAIVDEIAASSSIS
jgi:hypothetical protein